MHYRGEAVHQDTRSHLPGANPPPGVEKGPKRGHANQMAGHTRTLVGLLLALTLPAASRGQACDFQRVSDVHGILQICCEEMEDAECSTGFPATCTTPCAEAIVPFESDCHEPMEVMAGMGMFAFDVAALSSFVVGADRQGGACSHTYSLLNAARQTGGTSCDDTDSRAADVTASCCGQRGTYECTSGTPWGCEVPPTPPGPTLLSIRVPDIDLASQVTLCVLWPSFHFVRSKVTILLP